MRMHRLINILLTLEDKKKITAKEMAERLEVSIRTVYRDIDTLCEAGIPICTEAGPGGGISFMEGYHTQVKHLDQEDLIYLYLNNLGIKVERSSYLARKSDTTLRKLERDLPESEMKNLHSLQERFIVDNEPWWGEKHRLPQMDQIVQAIWQLHKLRVVYEKVDQTRTDRIIRPYGIVVKDNVWYLVGYCERSNAIRIFRCERITSCTLLNESFLYPEDFHLKTYFAVSLKEFKGNCNLQEQYAVSLVATENIFPQLKDLEYTVKKAIKSASYEICVNLFGFENALRDYWNILIQAEILEPVELRNAVQQMLVEAERRYNNHDING
ncbi:helix-turn-helix transcriptional regulator [Anaerosporobacter faecicola]|uniref:helix-turn-helix transcriptional regulator n=1 Tax=Anaerosporobacter faecicola TaxID=2718714 RepID=UPI00143B3818|nr:YafY family protein [Anaerosporobacter faecicola]